MTGDGAFIDGNRTCSLHSQGGHDLLAATVIGADATYLAIVDADRLGDGTPLRDPHCRAVAHEQLGPLPADTARRIALAQRAYRCGCPTESGRPCQVVVSRPGDACEWHGPTEGTNGHAKP